MEAGARSRASVEEADDEAGDLESIHAGVDHGQGTIRARSCPATCSTGSRVSGATSRRLRVERRGRGGDVPDSVGLPGVPRAQVCTAWLEPSGRSSSRRAPRGAFVTRREIARAFDLPLERVRVIAEPLGGRSVASSRSSSRSRWVRRSR
jgi:hypothetical protein